MMLDDEKGREENASIHYNTRVSGLGHCQKTPLRVASSKSALSDSSGSLPLLSNPRTFTRNDVPRRGDLKVD